MWVVRIEMDGENEIIRKFDTERQARDFCERVKYTLRHDSDFSLFAQESTTFYDREGYRAQVDLFRTHQI